MKHRAATRLVALALTSFLVGGVLMALTPADAAMKSSISTIWKKIKPKADKRYVKKTAQSKIVRSVSVTAETGPAVTTTVTLMSTSITAPTNGFLLITETADFSVNSVTPVIHCGLSVDGDGSWPSTWSLSNLVTGNGTGWTPCPLTARVPVAAGTHTVDLQAHNDGSGTLSFNGGNMTVLFEPYGATGGAGADRVVPQRPSRGDIAK